MKIKPSMKFHIFSPYIHRARCNTEIDGKPVKTYQQKLCQKIIDETCLLIQETGTFRRSLKRP